MSRLTRFYVKHVLRAQLTATMTLFLTATSAIAADVGLQCPAEIPASLVKVSTPVPGWTPFTNSVLYLSGAALMNGPPSMRADLVPYSSSDRKSASTVTWKFDGPFPDGKWLSCTYGDGGEVSLAREIPNTTVECVLHYKKGGKVGSNTIHVDCR